MEQPVGGIDLSCDDPGDRIPERERHHRHGRGCERIPVGARFCSLDRAESTISRD
jgi:hypothetical protein